MRARKRHVGALGVVGALVVARIVIADPEPLARPDGEILDVALGALTSIQQVPFSRIGPYPTGRNGLSMSTTSCNVGTVEVPWHAPMEEDHPFIAMQLYREMDGRFEQIGVSWVKHAYFALAENYCDPCQGVAGQTLGVGCSDTYTNSNNARQDYLGPREEIDPYTGTWSCFGSYFAGGQDDCIDRRLDNEYDVVDHRLEVMDGELDVEGAEYVYEAMYVVAGDENLANNIGSRRCTMDWGGTEWTFSTPSQDNELVYGPALERWGEMQSWVDVGTTDGRVLLAVQTTDLGEGLWRYEYALFNMDSHRRVRAFAVPTGDETPVDMTFHDWDEEAANDWAITTAPGVVRWETEPFDVNPEAHALTFGLLFNFGLTVAAPPVEGAASLGIFLPPGEGRGEPESVIVSTLAPDDAVPVEPDDGVPGVSPSIARIGAPAPNPASAGTAIPFALDEPAAVTLAVFDAGGRRVATLLEGRPLAPGAHRAVWDGRDVAGRPAAAGVYFVRLVAAGRAVGGRAVVLTR